MGPLSRPLGWRFEVGGVVLIALVVQGWNIVGFPAVHDDEGTYLSQAWAIQHGGGLAHYTYWYDQARMLGRGGCRPARRRFEGTAARGVAQEKIICATVKTIGKNAATTTVGA
jgi:hypothetical protein